MEDQMEFIHVEYIVHVFARLAQIFCFAQSVLVNKISASELRRKFIESALLVGHVKCGVVAPTAKEKGEEEGEEEYSALEFWFDWFPALFFAHITVVLNLFFSHHQSIPCDPLSDPPQTVTRPIL